jgi:NAD(P)H-dependent flavin oxidoreductase YrpB (nitropropane dioxygenase family)
MRTRMTELFGIKHPVMCGGMMWLAKPELCSAISNAGGLGDLTAGNYELGSELGKAIDKTRQLTDKPFCVNITLLPSVRITKEMHQDYFQTCCEKGVAAIEISGAPLDRYLGIEAISQAKKAGVKLIHKVGSVRHARHAESAGYDAVIAAGFEEGGHPLSDDVTTMLLTPRISESVKIPVITAGGIADGRSLAAALVLGAEGVMMASRFVATKECTAHSKIKEEIIRRQENDTTLICRTIDLQMRALKNELVGKVLEVEGRHGGLDEILPLISGKRSEEALEKGDVDRERPSPSVSPLD